MALLVVIGLLAIKGAVRGFFREAFGLLALASGVGASVFFGGTVGHDLATRWDLSPTVARTLAHLGLFLGPYIGFQALGYVLYRLGRTVFLGGFDRMAGALFGALAGVLLSGAALTLLAHSQRGESWLRGSKLARPVTEAFLQAAEWGRGVGSGPGD